MVLIPLVALAAAGGRSPGRRGGVQVEAAGMAEASLAAPAVGDIAVWRRLGGASEVAGAPPVTTTEAPSTTVARHTVTTGTTRHTLVSSGTARVAHYVRPAPAPTTTTTTAAPRPSQTGPASWYPAPQGTCAHQTLPFGTVVTILDLDNGRTATCTVDDRGPYEGNRIIDLSPDVFGQLEPTSTGVIDVRISW